MNNFDYLLVPIIRLSLKFHLHCFAFQEIIKRKVCYEHNDRKIIHPTQKTFVVGWEIIYALVKYEKRSKQEKDVKV